MVISGSRPSSRSTATAPSTAAAPSPATRAAPCRTRPYQPAARPRATHASTRRPRGNWTTTATIDRTTAAAASTSAQAAAAALPLIRRRSGRAPRASSRPAWPLPGQLDLELDAVVLDLELHLEVHVVRHGDGEVHATTVELDVVVTRQRVGERVQARGHLLPAERLLLLDLDEVHGPTLWPPRARRQGAHPRIGGVVRRNAGWWLHPRWVGACDRAPRPGARTTARRLRAGWRPARVRGEATRDASAYDSPSQKGDPCPR